LERTARYFVEFYLFLKLTMFVTRDENATKACGTWKLWLLIFFISFISMAIGAVALGLVLKYVIFEPTQKSGKLFGLHL
jgi:hypothetical protein